jgi:hypothetical protein
MASETTNPNWMHSLVGRSADKRFARPAATQADWEHIGVDYMLPGGLRPSTGFRHVRTLTGGAAEGLLSSNQYVDGFFPVTFRVTASETATGFVYRVKTNGNGERVWLEFRRNGTGYTWSAVIDLFGLLDIAGEMDVRVVGKYVWVFREGAEPVFFYYDETATDDIARVTDTGAGPPPVLVADDRNIICNEIDDARIDNGDLFGVTTGIRSKVTSTASLALDGPPDDNSAAVKLWLFEWNADGINYTWPVRGPGEIYLNHTTGPTTLTDRYLLKIGGETVTSLNAYTFNPEPWADDATPSHPDYERHRWYNGYAGVRASSVSGGQGFDTVSFIVQFFDSRTGRKSNFSEAITRPLRSFSYESQLVGTAPADSVVGARDAAGVAVVFPMLEILYDETKWDTLLVYRTVRNNNTFKLDNLITLADYETAIQTYDADDDDVRETALPSPWKRAAYFYELQDGALVGVQSLADYQIADEEMPTAGAAIFHEGTMLFGNTASLNTENGTVGMVQWSDPYALSVEQVSPENRYYLQLPTDEVERFELLGPNVGGFSRQGIYLFRKETTFIKGYPLHVGYGAVHPRAVCAVGSIVYFCTAFGIKTIDASGAISNISVADYVVMEEWKGTHSKVRMAYDATASVIFVLRGNFGEATFPQMTTSTPRGRMVCLWLNSGKMSEFYDTNFSHAIEGDIWEDFDSPTSSLRRRACFLQEARLENGVREWRVYVWDYSRAKTKTTLLDSPSTSGAFRASTNFPAGGAIPSNELPAPMTTGERMEGMTVYVLTGVRAGSSARILYRKAADGRLRVLDTESLNGVVAGDILTVNPMYFRWTGPQLGMQGDEGAFFGGDDYFRQRRVDTIACAFSEVSGTTIPANLATDYTRFFGLIWRGGATTPEERATAYTTGDGILINVTEGPNIIPVAFGTRTDGSSKGIRGASLHPSVEMFLPSVDFRLLGVRTTGTIESKNREGVGT